MPKFCKDCLFTRKQDTVYAFCIPCKNIRKNDLVEIITKVDNKISSEIYQDITTAENTLKTLSANIRYDLHGVLDTVDKDITLSNHTSCAISFVGLYSKIRLVAYKDVVNRILSNQIEFGILIFRRGHKKLKNIYTVPGSKAWVNKLLSYENKCMFIDDSSDHYFSTKYLQMPDLTCVLKDENTNLQDIVNKF